MIRNFPYSEDPEDFDYYSGKVLKSKYISKEQKDYLKEKLKTKKLWVKAFIKDQFACGMCSTSRVEGKHRIFKLYLNSSSRLTHLFKVFKDLEKNEICNYKDEIEKFNKKENDHLGKSSLVKYFSLGYSDYVLLKLKQVLNESHNCKYEKVGSYW